MSLIALTLPYTLTTHSKFSICPTTLHYGYLKGVLKYICHTKHWGIRFCHSCLPSEFPDLPEGDFSSPPSPLPSTFPSFPDTDDSQLVCYVDAANGNDPRKRRSTTGFFITLFGGAIVYKSKTQSCTALSSTKAEFYSVISAAKAVHYRCSVLCELHLEQKGPTTIFEYNEACIKVINAKHPTDCTKHINTPYFRVQSWKQDGHIIMCHISGIINCSDTLTKPNGWSYSPTIPKESWDTTHPNPSSVYQLLFLLHPILLSISFLT